MSRSTKVGPALGGIIVIPLVNPVAAPAGLADTQQLFFRFAGYIAAISGVNAAAAGTTLGVDTGGFSQLTVASSGLNAYLLTNEGKGEATTTPVITGIQMRALDPAEGDPVTAESNRFLDRFPTTYPQSNQALFQSTTNVGIAALDYTAHVFMVPMSFPYDTDNPAHPNYDPLYYSAKD